jgi:hypothetical protein
MINKVAKYQLSLLSVIDDLKDKIITKYSNFPEIYKKKIDSISFVGFDEIKGNLRSLDEEYNLYEIEDVFNSVKEKYEDLRQKVLTYDEYYGIVNEKAAFVIILSNTASTLTNDFYAYRHLIAQYTDNSQIDDYFKSLENSAEEIRNDTIKFIIDCSNEINNTLNIIYNGMRDSWYEIRQGINPYLYQTLDEVFTEKFSNLIDLSEDGNIPDYLLEPDPIDLPKSKDKEKLGTIYFDVNIVNQKFGYSLKRLNNYDFIMDVYVNGTLDLTATTNANNQISEVMSRRLASGKVGVTANYTLHNKSVDINA